MYWKQSCHSIVSHMCKIITNLIKTQLKLATTCMHDNAKHPYKLVKKPKLTTSDHHVNNSGEFDAQITRAQLYSMYSEPVAVMSCTA